MTNRELIRLLNQFKLDDEVVIDGLFDDEPDRDIESVYRVNMFQGVIFIGPKSRDTGT